MALRSAHLPGDHVAAFQDQVDSGYCPECATVVCEVNERITSVEQRWRVVQHHLLHCTSGLALACRPPLQMLQDDLLDTAAGYPACADVVRAAFAYGGD